MIDLHLHTTYSDGSDSLIELLIKAEQCGLELISITDHNEVKAYYELENIDVRKYFSGKIITGVEISTVYQGRMVEILGFGMDIYKLEASSILFSDEINHQSAVLERHKNIGRSIGLKFDENLKLDAKHLWASAAFGKEIFRYPENMAIIKEYGLGPEWAYFFRNGQSNPNSIFYIDFANNFPTPDKVIKEIHKAGGLAFLAHPLLYSYDDKLATIEQFINEYDIDGLECHYSLFNSQETKSLVDLCIKYNKFVCGGSDYHGTLKEDIALGVGKGDLHIPSSIVSDWVNIDE